MEKFDRKPVVVGTLEEFIQWASKNKVFGSVHLVDAFGEQEVPQDGFSIPAADYPSGVVVFSSLELLGRFAKLPIYAQAAFLRAIRQLTGGMDANEVHLHKSMRRFSKSIQIIRDRRHGDELIFTGRSF